ncbi:E3 ubiquitin-protein ligase TM129 [Battus philenor]|uniref:E3 ubiquitin-protein ligase TM129 n=1 Tax=Battus philenor TaxID=42288 RepID=UPI0035CE86E4
MDIVLTLFYLMFCFCVIYPPTEFVAAGFTIPQIFEGFLGSENVNFIGYHMKRITLTAFIHSSLPLGYVFTLWCGGERGSWMLASAIATAIILLLMCYKILCWWEYDKDKHPVVRPLIKYAPSGGDWRVVANSVNISFRGIDKVCLPLTATSKFVATDTWLIKVTQYGMNIIKQGDCSLVATTTDSYNLSQNGEYELQYVNIEVIPMRSDLEQFSLRLSVSALRELQPRLTRPVQVPDHISIMPSLIERFVTVFKYHVDQNPIYYVDQELEQCIGCMQNIADVKIDRRCIPVPEPLEGIAPPPCQQCNCRVLWCCSCVARWWAARASAAMGPGGERAGAQGAWLASRGSCPVCRAVFCVLDVLPVRPRRS